MTMFDQPGITLDDLEWIQRDEFVHYLTLAHELGHPSDWSTFRRELLAAVAAVYGFAAGPAKADGHPRDTLDILDSIRSRHDPGRDWPKFMDCLWAARHHVGRARDHCL